MTPLLWRASRRYLLRHPWQFGLSILGVALGVSVVVSVDLANASAGRAFELSTEAVTGRTTHQIVGGGSGVPEALYRRLRLELGVRDAAPVMEEWVRLGEAPGRTLRLLGVDPLAEAPVRPWLAALPGGSGAEATADGGRPSAAGLAVGPLMTRPGAALLPGPTAVELGLEPGDDLEVTVDGRRVSLELVGLIRPGSDLARAALRDLLVVDVATAQELLGRVGRLDRIDLRLPDDDAVGRVRRALPDSLSLVEAAARSRTTLEMTQAFRLNLTAMSLLALVCGTFLIYNTMTFSVVQRRGLIGALRALGVTRRQVFGLVLAEAALVGAVGTVVGLAGGVLLGTGLVRLVTRTINDLYFVLEVRELAVQPAVLLRGAALGLGATLLATLAPAREATTAPPRTVLTRSAVESRARRSVPWLAAAGALSLLGGAAALAATGRSLLPSFGGLFALVLGATLLTPAATALLARLARPPSRAAFGILGGMAARGISANLSRTAVAIAALMVAVSVIIGVGVMVDSFRTTLEGWLGYTLQADLYVSPAGSGPGGDLEGVPELRRRLAREPAVDRVQTLRRRVLETGEGRTVLLAVELPVAGRDAYRLVAGDADEAWSRWDAGGVLVSEPYAWRRRVGPDDRLRLPTDDGMRSFRVAGVFASYASDQGAVMVARETYERHWRDRGHSGASIYLRPGADVGAVAEVVRATLGRRQQIVVRTERALRQESLEVFDRTFRITGVLRLLVTLVAFVGVLSALMAMQLERARELGVLRATGLTPRQVLGLVTAQTGLLGLFAGLLSLPLGLLLAWVMVHVINRRSFGWSLTMEVSPEILLQAMAVAVGAALLAGIWPARRMARTPPARALREE